MLYCRKCGNPVEDADVFCSSCMSRLSVPGAVITKREISFEANQSSEFNPDAIQPSLDLCGFEVLGHRLVERAAYIGGADYYSAVAVDGGSGVSPYIRHIMLSDEDSVDMALFGTHLDAERAHYKTDYLLKSIVSEQLSFQQKCSIAGVESLNYGIKTYSSTLHGSYHVFFLMKKAIPLPYYLSKYQITMRQAIEISLKVCEGIIKLRRSGYDYGSFSDEMIFVSQERDVYLGTALPFMMGNLSSFDNSFSRYRMFVAPDEADKGVYSLSMMLYLMLSGYRHPWCNPVNNDILSNEYIEAECNRIRRKQPYTPYLAMNMLGSMVIGSLSEHDGTDFTIEDFNSALKNSFNFISSAELDEFIPTGNSRSNV